MADYGTRGASRSVFRARLVHEVETQAIGEPDRLSLRVGILPPVKVAYPGGSPNSLEGAMTEKEPLETDEVEVEVEEEDPLLPPVPFGDQDEVAQEDEWEEDAKEGGV
jgi:hypothetical protein